MIMRWTRRDIRSSYVATDGTYTFVVSKESQMDRRDPWCASMYRGDEYGELLEEQCYLRTMRQAQDLCEEWNTDY